MIFKKLLNLRRKKVLKKSVLRGANEALIVRYPTYKGRVSLEDSLLMVGN